MMLGLWALWVARRVIRGVADDDELRVLGPLLLLSFVAIPLGAAPLAYWAVLRASQSRSLAVLAGGVVIALGWIGFIAGGLPLGWMILFCAGWLAVVLEELYNDSKK